MRLDFDALCDRNYFNLSFDPTPCFLMSITIKCNKSMTTEIEALLDFDAFTCFIDKDFVQQLKLPLVKKTMLVAMEVINGQNLSL